MELVLFGFILIAPVMAFIADYILPLIIKEE